MQTKTPVLSFASAVLVVAALTPTFPQTAHAAETGYDGGFFVEGEKGEGLYRIRFNGRLQTRLTLEMFEAEGKDAEIALAVQRARFGFEGYFLTKALTYKFQADFGAGKVGLKDYYWDYAFSDGVHLRAGQWKKPFSRQQITSSGRLELVDRAATDKAFGAGRDVGLGLHSNYEEADGFNWAIGVFNGAGENVLPDVWQPEGVVRAGYTSAGFGKGQYSEGDLECADKPEVCGLRWAVAASVYADGGMPKDGNKGQVVSEFDLVLKVSGFALSGAFFVDFNLGEDADGGGMDKLGFYAQASYYIAAAKIAPIFRFSSIMPDSDAVAKTNEATLGISFYPSRHNLKWQTDATMVMNALGDVSTTDWVIRTEAQLAF